MLRQGQGLISTCGREQVHQQDVTRLTPGQWLNDEIINFYGAMIMARAERWHRGDFSDISFFPPDPKRDGVKYTKGKTSENGDPLQVHYLNTFFCSKLSGSEYEMPTLTKGAKKGRVDFH